MKFITAIIQPQKLDAVREELQRAGVTGLTVGDVQGYGRQHGHMEVYRGHEYQIQFVRKVRIEIGCDDEHAPGLVELLTRAAKSGNGAIGDGKIFVSELEDAVRIRTGERGKDAL